MKMFRISLFAAIKGVVLYVLDVLKFIFCRKKFRRKLSADITPLTTIAIVPNDIDQESGINWESWSTGQPSVSNVDKPKNINDQYIQLYRQQLNVQRNNIPTNDEQSNIDLFQDMAPKITHQMRVLLKKDEPSDMSNNFSPSSTMFAYDSLEARSSELVDWEDEENCNWDVGDDRNVSEMIREKRRLDREKRAALNLKKKSEKDRNKAFAMRVH